MDAGVASALKKSSILFAFEAFFFKWRIVSRLKRQKPHGHTNSRKVENEKLVLDR